MLLLLVSGVAVRFRLIVLRALIVTIRESFLVNDEAFGNLFEKLESFGAVFSVWHGYLSIDQIALTGVDRDHLWLWSVAVQVGGVNELLLVNTHHLLMSVRFFF